MSEEKDPTRQVNPAARRDRPEEEPPTIERPGEEPDEKPKGYQDTPRDPKDQGGIRE
jgi:hypothetical protein